MAFRVTGDTDLRERMPDLIECPQQCPCIEELAGLLAVAADDERPDDPRLP